MFLSGSVTVVPEESRVGSRCLHSSDDQFLLIGADDVDELGSSDRVVWDMSDTLFEVVRQAGADKYRDIRVWPALPTKISK